jgi:hypothetical protein
MAAIPPLIAAIFDEADRRWPNRSHASDGAIGDPRHQAAGGDHVAGARGYVHAVDLTHDPRGGFDAWVQANRMRRRCQSLAERRVKYLVSHDPTIRNAWGGLGHDVIASPIGGWGWRLLNNPNDGPTALDQEEPMQQVMQPGRTKDRSRPACATLDRAADVLVLWNGASIMGDIGTPYGVRLWKIPSQYPALSFKGTDDGKGVLVMDTRGFGYLASWS